MKRLAIVLLGGVALAPGAFAKPDAKAPPPDKKAPDPSLEGGSKAVTDKIIDTIAEEMNRQITQLEIPNAPKPYLISYKITEVDVNDVSASLGNTTSKRNRHFVNLEARVRVGNEKFDNSNFVVPQADEIDGVAATNLPLEATPRIARRATWLVTDAAYKEALMQLRAKIEARGGIRMTEAPAWTSAKPVVSETPVLVQPLETLDEIETRAKALSATFRDNTHVKDSRVAVTSYLERRWYLSTEGTSVTDTRRASGVMMVAHGQAEDGQLLAQYFLRYGTTAKDLPNDGDLTKEAKGLGDTIALLEKAPAMDKKYRGPVLFEGEGAVGVIRASLAPHLGGTPVPEGLNPQEAKGFGGALTDSIGQLVMPRNVTIYDDPTAKVGGGKSLIGGYKLDDEGVPAQRVEVVKDGTLKTLLTSRTPAHKGEVSNGHARRTAEGGAFHGSATNLFFNASGGTSRAALVGKLLAAAQARGLKYGMIVKRMDDAAITGVPEFTRRELVQMIKSTDQQLPPPAILAYRVYPNGKQELVRGAGLAEIPIDAWEDLLGTSTEITTYNYLAATESQLQLKLSAGTDEGFVPSGGIESGIVTPDLLFKKIAIKGMVTERPLPIVAKPGK